MFSLSLAPEQPFVWLWVCWDYFQVANQPTRSENSINVIRYLRFDFPPNSYQWNDKHLTLNYSHMWIVSLNILFTLYKLGNIYRWHVKFKRRHFKSKLIQISFHMWLIHFTIVFASGRINEKKNTYEKKL